MSDAADQPRGPESGPLFTTSRHIPSPEDRPEISGYVLRHPIGQGGHATTWIAEQERPIARTVAIKVFRARESGELVLQWFRAERAALARLPAAGFCALYDAGLCSDGRPFIAMEFIDGESLDAWLTRYAGAHADIIELFAKIARSMSEAHRLGIVHLDLKPSNVLVSGWPDGARIPRILDFGLALPTGAASHGAGSAGFTAPEVARREPIDARADIFAFGCMLDAACARIGQGDATGVALKRLAGECMRGDRELRPRSMIDVSARIEAIRRNADVRPTAPHARMFVAGMLACALLAAASAGLLGLERGGMNRGDRAFAEGRFRALDLSQHFNAPRASLRGGAELPSGRARFRDVPFLLGSEGPPEEGSTLCCWSGGMKGAIGPQSLEFSFERVPVRTIHLLAATMWGRAPVELIHVEVETDTGFRRIRTLRTGADIRDYYDGKLDGSGLAREAVRFGRDHQIDVVSIPAGGSLLSGVRIVDEGGIGVCRALVFGCTIEVAE